MDEVLVENCMMYIALNELKRLFTPIERRPLHVGGEPGCYYMHRLLTGHPNLCYEQLRLGRDIFIKLANVLREKNLLSDGRFVYVEEQLGICLFIMAKVNSYRDAAERFQHSISTICMYLKSVLRALVSLGTEIIRPYQSLNEIPPEIQEKSLYWPYFKDCIGTLDGTHIEACIGDLKGRIHRGRKWNKTWNVMAACSFNMLFTFVNVGFEGSAHDSSVWRHCLGDATIRFPHPPSGKYYLVDSGYPNTIGYLSPYQGKELRYHLPDFQEGDMPEGMFEHFNYRHSSLRTTIERCFGVVKKRWKILKMMPQMPDTYQLAIVVTCCTLHNFIRLHNLMLPISHEIDPIEPRADHNMYEKSRKKAMNNVRKSITDVIWQSLGNNIEETQETDVRDTQIDDDNNQN